MAEYIERERAIDALERIDWYHINDRGRLILGGSSEMETYVPFKTVEDMLKSIPAADDAEGRDFYDGILFAADWISKQPTIIEAKEET